MRKLATSENAINALDMLTNTQNYFVKQLTALCQLHYPEQLSGPFSPQMWLRDEGLHGGGTRFEAQENNLFNRASVNVSQIQYEDNPEKKFVSATALSTIIHPKNPQAPSVHIHISWTQLRSGESYWRLMADLNPAISCETDTAKFNQNLALLAGEYYEQGKKEGDKYFYIPSLQSHRGVSHFYLEGFNPKDDQGLLFSKQFVEGIIDSYIEILSEKVALKTLATNKQKQTQLDYHTLYFYQVLTLDKGTTAGLLIHNQNDVGTLGSLPRFINRALLSEWAEKTPAPRDQLVRALVSALPNNEEKSEVSTEVKINIAKIIREHYQTYPLSLTP